MGLKGLILMVVLSTTMLACSLEEKQGTRNKDRGAEQITTYQGITTSGEGAESTSALKGETTTSDSPPRWDYVALGDSLAVGVGARRGYVTRYAEHLRGDTGLSVTKLNAGEGGQTTASRPYAVLHHPAMR